MKTGNHMGLLLPAISLAFSVTLVYAQQVPEPTLPPGKAALLQKLEKRQGGGKSVEDASSPGKNFPHGKSGEKATEQRSAGAPFSAPTFAPPPSAKWPASSEIPSERAKERSRRELQVRESFSPGMGEPMPKAPQHASGGVSSESDSNVKSRGIDKKDIRRGLVIPQPSSLTQGQRTSPVSQTRSDESQQPNLAVQKREQLRSRLEELKKSQHNGDRPESQTENKSLPGVGRDRSHENKSESGRLTRDQLRKQLEERRGKSTTQEAPQDGGMLQESDKPLNKDVRNKEGQKLTREELKQRLQDKLPPRDKDKPWRSGEETKLPSETLTKPTPEASQGQAQEKGRSRDELRRRVEELRRKKNGQETEAPPQEGAVSQEQSKPATRDDVKKRLEELRAKKQSQGQEGIQASPTPEGELSDREKLVQQRRELLQQAGQKEKAKPQLPPEEREKIRALVQQSEKKDVREIIHKLRAQEQAEKGMVDPENFKAKLQELRRIKAEERSELVGANLSEKKAQLLEARLAQKNKFDAEEFRRRIGEVQAKPRIELASHDIERLHRGEVPPTLRPVGSWGEVRRPLDRELRYRHERWFCPPPPSRRGYGIDFVGFHWEYWDGRHRYDHHWAINIFISVGHTRYGGFDGVIVGGRYFSYGWGWIDGCIDYGDCRIWVPGFWAPYTVTECCECEVWVPPVYDWVWTGCCWEQVLVSGGYFVRQPAGCHTVTRWRWVPGHFQYYRC